MFPKFERPTGSRGAGAAPFQKKSSSTDWAAALNGSECKKDCESRTAGGKKPEGLPPIPVPKVAFAADPKKGAGKAAGGKKPEGLPPIPVPKVAFAADPKKGAGKAAGGKKPEGLPPIPVPKVAFAAARSAA